MKNKGLAICRFNAEFLRYTEMIEFIDRLFDNDFVKLTNKLKKDLVDLKGLKVACKDCLNECDKQINFIENFLDDCGVNIYEL